MSPEEQEELFMFVESRKEKAQGQGEVKSFKKKNKKVSSSFLYVCLSSDLSVLFTFCIYPN